MMQYYCLGAVLESYEEGLYMVMIRTGIRNMDFYSTEFERARNGQLRL